MNCWACNTELIWGGDHDIPIEDDDEHSIVTNLSCPKCEALVIVYHDKREENKCIEILIKQGMTNEDAIDYFMFFEEDSWVGEGDEIPLFLNRMSFKDYLELYEYKGYLNDNQKET